MIEEESPRMGSVGVVASMMRAVQKRTPLSGDHGTAIPELTLHRRNKPTQVVHCIYTLGMAVTLQGSKHVLLGDKPLSYGPGQSLLTTIDLPVSHHTRYDCGTLPRNHAQVRSVPPDADCGDARNAAD
jgi:hypothetical protein